DVGHGSPCLERVRPSAVCRRRPCSRRPEAPLCARVARRGRALRRRPVDEGRLPGAQHEPASRRPPQRRARPEPARRFDGLLPPRRRARPRGLPAHPEPGRPGRLTAPRSSTAAPVRIRGKKGTHPMGIQHATDDTFEQLVLKNDKPTVVDFWATWCGPCKMVAPELEKIAAKYEGAVDVVKVDVDANPRISQAFNIMSIPTIAFFRPGQQPLGVAGARPMEAPDARFGLAQYAPSAETTATEA